MLWCACMSAPHVFACVLRGTAVDCVCVILSGAKDCCSGNTVLLLLKHTETVFWEEQMGFSCRKKSWHLYKVCLIFPGPGHSPQSVPIYLLLCYLTIAPTVSSSRQFFIHFSLFWISHPFNSMLSRQIKKSIRTAHLAYISRLMWDFHGAITISENVPTHYIIITTLLKKLVCCIKHK